MTTHRPHPPATAKVGDDVVVMVGDQEVAGRVRRVTPRAIEVEFELKLPPGALGAGLGHLTWRSGRETLFPLADVQAAARVRILVDLEDQPPEQRSFVRLDRRLAVDVAVEGEEGPEPIATGSTQDLSTEGAKLVLNRGLKKGESVALRIHLDEAIISCGAEVLRRRKRTDGTYEVAVRFLLPHGDDRTRLVRYVFARMRATK